MSDLKTSANKLDPQSIIEVVENKTRRENALTLLELFRQATGLPAVVWGPSIIGFGEYTYTLANGKSELFFRSGFSPRKQNLSLYISAGISSRPDLAAKLGKFKSSKSCTYINKLADVDLDVLVALIRADMEEMAHRYTI
jgi:hypothetical protein